MECLDFRSTDFGDNLPCLAQNNLERRAVDPRKVAAARTEGHRLAQFAVIFAKCRDWLVSRRSLRDAYTSRTSYCKKKLEFPFLLPSLAHQNTAWAHLQYNNKQLSVRICYKVHWTLSFWIVVRNELLGQLSR